MDKKILKELYLELEDLFKNDAPKNTTSRDVPPTIRDPDSPATDKQKWKLKKLGYTGNTALLTKQEASDKISEYEG